MKNVQVLTESRRAAPGALLRGDEGQACRCGGGRALDRGSFAPLVEGREQVPVGGGRRNHARDVRRVSRHVSRQSRSDLAGFPEPWADREAVSSLLVGMRVRVVLVPVVRLGRACRITRADLHHHVRDVARGNVGVVPLLRHSTGVWLRVVHEDDEAAADPQPCGVARVVGLQVKKVAGDLGLCRRDDEALLLVIDGPADVPHLAHSQQEG